MFKYILLLPSIMSIELNNPDLTNISATKNSLTLQNREKIKTKTWRIEYWGKFLLGINHNVHKK